MARELIIIRDIQSTEKGIGVIGQFIGENNEIPKKKELLQKKIKISTKKGDINSTIKDAYVNLTLSNMYVIALGLDMKDKKSIEIDDIVYIEE